MQYLYKTSQLLNLAPAVSTRPDETHSALIVSQESFQGSVRFEGSVCTLEQLRVGTANPWETAWLVWNYTDNDHFYYVALKPNGWELGKRDPDYAGGQRFLATGTDVTFEVGKWNRFEITQDGNRIVISVDGVELVRFQDLERPYLGGKIGLYTEDARVMLDDVRGSLSDNFDHASAVALHDGTQLGDLWDVAFLGHGTGGVVSGTSLDLGVRAQVADLIPFEPPVDPGEWSSGWILA
jgi:hypothetical protein